MAYRTITGILLIIALYIDLLSLADEKANRAGAKSTSPKPSSTTSMDDEDTTEPTEYPYTLSGYNMTRPHNQSMKFPNDTLDQLTAQYANLTPHDELERQLKQSYYDLYRQNMLIKAALAIRPLQDALEKLRRHR